VIIPGIFLPRPGGAIVHIELPALLPTIELAGRFFQVKSEFHVTLLGREILRRAGLPDSPEIRRAIRGAASGVEFTVEFLDDFRLASEGEAASIVRICRVAGAEEFFHRFESHLRSPIPRPPYHVTLYVAGTRKGIAICSPSDLERLGRHLDPRECETLLRIIT
jgi:hypothetical protein